VTQKNTKLTELVSESEKINYDAEASLPACRQVQHKEI
jgi:hypothetical protein